VKNHAYHAELFFGVKFEMQKKKEIGHTFPMFWGKKLPNLTQAKFQSILPIFRLQWGFSWRTFF
jgi:hypothetical protein